MENLKGLKGKHTLEDLKLKKFHSLEDAQAFLEELGIVTIMGKDSDGIDVLYLIERGKIYLGDPLEKFDGNNDHLKVVSGSMKEGYQLTDDGLKLILGDISQK